MISEVVPSIRTSDTGISALNWMDIFKVTHLPIVNDKEFLGLISETDIYDLNCAEEPIGNHHLSLVKPYATDEQHVLELMEMAARLKLSLIPILDRQKNYLGVVTLTDLLHYFADSTALTNPGSIIVLELNNNDYTLSQVAQIVEGNDAKILGSFVTSSPQSTMLELTLKLNVTDVTSIIQTFNRYGYSVMGSFMKHDDEEDLLADRYNLLMRYLDT